MDDNFHDWSEDYNPFDAIGFPGVGLEPPSPQDFAKSIHFARFVFDRAESRELDADQLILPYTKAQVEEAVKFFTQASSAEHGHESADEDVWQWAYQSIIVYKNRNKYARTWTPERFRLDKVVLKEPLIIDMTAIRAYESVSNHSSNESAKQHLSTPAPEECRYQMTFTEVTPIAVTTPRTSESFSVPLGDAERPPDMVNHWTQTTEVAVVESKQAQRGRTPGTLELRGDCWVLKPGTCKAGVKVFVGFQKAQVSMAGRFDTEVPDHRQHVYGTITTDGHVQLRLCRSTEAEVSIPWKYHICNGATFAKHGGVLYTDAFVGLNWDEVRQEVGRQTLLSQQEDATCTPTPFEVRRPDPVLSDVVSIGSAPIVTSQSPSDMPLNNPPAGSDPLDASKNVVTRSITPRSKKRRSAQMEASESDYEPPLCRRKKKAAKKGERKAKLNPWEKVIKTEEEAGYPR